MDVDDKVLLEHYRLEKDFDGAIELESTEGGLHLLQEKQEGGNRRKLIH